MQLNEEVTIETDATMSFSLQRYWKLKDKERLEGEPRYDEELLWANWNPEVPTLLRSTCPLEDDPDAQPGKPGLE